MTRFGDELGRLGGRPSPTPIPDLINAPAILIASHWLSANVLAITTMIIVLVITLGNIHCQSVVSGSVFNASHVLLL